MVINALNLTLSRHVQSSSASDPFVLKALAALDEGSPLFTQATLSDWSFDNGHLYFRKQLYSDKQNCYNVWYFCSVHNIVLACM